MGQILTGKFIATGADVELDLKHIPGYLKLYNKDAINGEAAMIEWWYQMGAGKELDIRKITIGTGTDSNLTYEITNAEIEALVESSSVHATDPVQPLGKRGVKIDASWMDDGDEIYYLAIIPDRDEDLGDAVNW